MNIAKMIVMLALVAAALPSRASAPYPWPWPWAVGCPIKWSEIERDWALPEVEEGSMVSISVSRMSKSSMLGIQVRRSDPGIGIHSVGFQKVGRNERSVTVQMAPTRKGVKPYRIRIGVYLYQSFRTETCDPEHVATVMSIEPKKSDAAGRPYNFVLEPGSRR